jgi:transcriptional regulator with XRE-family HTH domain
MVEKQQTEEWRWLPGKYRGLYSASSMGRICSFKRSSKGHILKGTKDPFGHIQVVLRKGSSRRWIFVHRAVMLAFHGEPPFEDAHVRHLNGVPDDNRLVNLKYGDAASNARDSIRHGTKPRGENSSVAKLTDEAVRTIRQIVKDTNGTISRKAVGEAFGVNSGHVGYLINMKKRVEAGGPDCRGVPSWQNISYKQRVAGPEAQNIISRYIEQLDQIHLPQAQIEEIPNERWKPVARWPDYEVSDHGRIRSFRRKADGVITLGGKIASGYRQVTLRRDDERKRFSVHQLVLRAFVGSPGPEQICRHLNGIPDDNRLENLKWGSQQDNADDRALHGSNVGPDPAVDLDTAKEILRWYVKGKKQEQLAKRYGCSRAVISYIINREGAYADLEGPEITRAHRKGGPKDVTHEEAVAIREAYAADRENTTVALGEQYDVSFATISKITRSEGKWTYLGEPVSKPPVISLELAQQVHDEYYRDKPTQAILMERYNLSALQVNDIVRRKDAFAELTPPSSGKTSRWIEQLEAEEIRKAYAADPVNTLDVLAQKHNSSIGTVNAIVLGKGRYSYFGSKVNRPPKKKARGISLTVAQQLLEQYAHEKVPRAELAARYGVSKTTVANIIKGRGAYAELTPC